MRSLGALGIGGFVAGVGVAYYVRRVSQQNGDGYVTALRQLPAQTRALAADAARRARLAVSEGRQAARMREDQVARQLTGVESSQAPD